jgi:hypothetical protein
MTLALMPWVMATLENGSAVLQAFLNNLGFEWFGIRASLAHGNPDVKGYRVHLGGHYRRWRRGQESELAGRLLLSAYQVKFIVSHLAHLQ